MLSLRWRGRLCQHLCQGGASGFQRSLGAEFLTAEAANTLFPVNFRQLVYHSDGLGGTNFGAVAAAHALRLLYLGNRSQGPLHHVTDKVSHGTVGLVAEEMAVQRFHLLKIRQNKGADKEFFENYLLQVSMALNTKQCKNIKANGATAANSGDNKQLMYNIMAGQEKDITITTDVEDFEMDPISISGVPMSFDIDTDQMDTSKLTDKTKDLKDGVKSLNDGAKQLKSGSSRLQSGKRKEWRAWGRESQLRIPIMKN